MNCPPLNLPETFVQNMVDVYGAEGRTWLASLPHVLKDLEKIWQLNLSRPMPNLTYSYVALAETKSGKAVIKLAPQSDRLKREIAWYQWQKKGCPKLFAHSFEHGAFLLEYLQPGVSLKQKVMEGQDDEATTIIAELILQLGPPTATDGTIFPHVSELEKDLALLKGKISDGLFRYALDLFPQLLAQREDVLLHGDLHHDNILSHGDVFCAIDPHGYRGPRAFEVGAFIRNPYDCFPKERSLERTLSSRLNILCDLLPFSREEIHGWALIYTLIAASWSIQDHGELPDEHVEIATIIFNQ